MLNTLASYLGGPDNVRKVVNSACLDHRGKMLSYDGTKVFTANNRFRNNRFNPGRGRGGRGGRDNRDQRRDNQSGKPNRGNGNKSSKGNSSVSFLRTLNFS